MGGGGARFRILGGGGQGGGGKLFAGCKLIRAPTPNQCQIVTCLTMKADNIAKLTIELNSIAKASLIFSTKNISVFGYKVV